MTMIAVDDRRDGPEDRRELPREDRGRRTSDKVRSRQHKVDCPFCGHWDSIVISSGKWRAEHNPMTGAFDRPRRCIRCGDVFETEERVKPK